MTQSYCFELKAKVFVGNVQMIQLWNLSMNSLFPIQRLFLPLLGNVPSMGDDRVLKLASLIVQ